MTKGNKLANTRETVYDRCAYVGCYNGKFINGRRLFHFPSETDRRLEMWIERSGNFRLRTWAATSLRKAGLCGDHFDDKCFTNATRKALRRNVVPRHYTEDLKLQKKNSESNTEKNENNKITELNEEEVDDPTNCDRLLNSPDESTGALKIGINSEKSFSQSGTNVIDKTTSKVEDRSRSSSPFVEFIVEELDEILVQADGKHSPSGDLMIDDPLYDSSDDKVDVKKPESFEQSVSLKDFEEIENSGSTINHSVSKLRTYYRSKDHRQLKHELTSGESEIFEDEDIKIKVKEAPISRVNNAIGCDKKRHDNMLVTLREQNTHLRKTMRLLKQKLRRSEARESKCLKARKILKNIDEFLDIQECTNPVARGIVKLALHKHNTPYTKEEKDCATQLYGQSSTAFDRLRAVGCNFPSKSTIKRWTIEEETGEPSNCDFMNVTENDDDQDQIIEDTHEISQDRMLDEVDEEMQEEMEETVEDPEDTINDLVDHLEEHIDDVQGFEEYVEELPPDDEH